MRTAKNITTNRLPWLGGVWICVIPVKKWLISQATIFTVLLYPIMCHNWLAIIRLTVNRIDISTVKSMSWMNLMKLILCESWTVFDIVSTINDVEIMKSIKKLSDCPHCYITNFVLVSTCPILGPCWLRRLQEIAEIYVVFYHYMKNSCCFAIKCCLKPFQSVFMHNAIHQVHAQKWQQLANITKTYWLLNIIKKNILFPLISCVCSTVGS